jgi:predicted negative regulator of RcsB-dependent stress response
LPILPIGRKKSGADQEGGNRLREILMWARQETVTLQAGVQSLIALGVAFGWWHWSAEQTGAVIAVMASFLGAVARTQVTPTSNPKSSAGEPLFTLEQARAKLYS